MTLETSRMTLISLVPKWISIILNVKFSHYCLWDLFLLPINVVNDTHLSYKVSTCKQICNLSCNLFLSIESIWLIESRNLQHLRKMKQS